MASLTFYEKPSCVTNRKQKALLTQAGIEFDCQDILTTEWSPSQLAEFLGPTGKASDMLNPNSPRVKNGEFAKVSDNAALFAAMVKDPLLIKRPLISVGDDHWAGFNLEKLGQYFKLPVALDGKNAPDTDLEACSKP